MDISKSFESQLYDINAPSFENIALSLFRHQAVHNRIYKKYIENLNVNLNSVSTLAKIPFLPISFFKRHQIVTGVWNAETEFLSSGTTRSTPSRHLIKDIQFYLAHSKRCFEFFFGKLTDYHFLALLPSYLERKNSSLVAMMNHFIQESQSPYSGFYLHNTGQLLTDLERLKSDNRKTILWGVTFALIDLAVKFQPDLSHCLIFETGGMKGREKEMTRREVHEILRKGFHVREIFSEYGMTELLSQAYSKGGDYFFCPPYMRVLARETTDPLNVGMVTTGSLNVVDLANFHSIAFIETEDVGKVLADGSFEVLGRMDNSEVRGCNLLVG